MINQIIHKFSGLITAQVEEIAYPDEVLSHSGKPLPVSKGGFVIVDNMDDAKVLLEDGITNIECDRDLGDEFYRSAEDANESVVAELSRLFNMIDQVSRRVRYKTPEAVLDAYKKVLDSFEKTLGREPNLVTRQAMKDIIEFHAPMQALQRQVNMKFGRDWDQGGFTYRGRQHKTSDTGNEYFVHVDELDEDGLIRGGITYLGKTTIKIDDRLTVRDIEDVVPSTSNSTPPGTAERILMKYDSTSSKLGNLSLMKAYQGCHQPTTTLDFNAKETIRNTCVHTWPMLEPDELRYAYFFNIV
tara:strand:- start:824 stop:1723 length:900 start_codon:yes stop_codon:yes gene_type:complete